LRENLLVLADRPFDFAGWLFGIAVDPHSPASAGKATVFGFCQKDIIATNVPGNTCRVASATT